MIRIFFFILFFLICASCKPHIKKGTYTFHSLFYTEKYTFKHKKVIYSYTASGYSVETIKCDFYLKDSSVVIFNGADTINEIKTITKGKKSILDTTLFNDRNYW